MNVLLLSDADWKRVCELAKEGSELHALLVDAITSDAYRTPLPSLVTLGDMQEACCWPYLISFDHAADCVTRG